MSSISPEIKRRKPWLSARQVAVVAVFGGLGFVFNALKITIPGYLPGLSFNFDGLWLTLATMIGGPIAGFVTCFLTSIPGDIGLWGWMGYAIHALVLSIFYPAIYHRFKGWARAGAFVGWNTVALLTQVWYFTALYAFVFKVGPFWGLMAFNMTYPVWGFIAIYSLVPFIVLLAAPKVVEPDWSWRRIFFRQEE
ncbi:MAG: hypothetical protein C4551_02660 [Bacillota bacterium]|nr:MAG: hypothetical protein C4551_02660 [Bacillota bacterium]